MSATRWSLKDDGEVKYSPREQTIFRLLPKGNGRRINTFALMNSFYKGGRYAAPYHARQAVNTTVRILQEKMAINKEPFTIKKTPPRGPHPAR